MRISQLSDATGVSVATLKFYLREGVLHPGRSLGATRADYDEGHVDRVRLVRTLVDVGRLTIERVREVVLALEDPPGSRHALLRTAHEVLREPGTAADQGVEVDGTVAALLESLGLSGTDRPTPATTGLVRALTAAQRGGRALDAETLLTWAAALREVARTDVSPDLAALSDADALRYAVVATVLTDPVLLALRRVEQERRSAELLGGR